MDFDSSSKFIKSLSKFLHSLCKGYVEFDKGVEVIGHIYVNIDSKAGKKIDYVLNEKVCKNKKNNKVTFISNSFHAQPAQKPKPASRLSDSEGDSGDESDDASPNSTNIGTAGNAYSSGRKRPRQATSRNSGACMPKMGRSDSPSNSNYDDAGEDYDGSNTYQGEDDAYGENTNQSIDQKPVPDPNISQHMAGGDYPENDPGPSQGQSQIYHPPFHQGNHPTTSSHSSEPNAGAPTGEGNHANRTGFVVPPKRRPLWVPHMGCPVDGCRSRILACKKKLIRHWSGCHRQFVTKYCCSECSCRYKRLEVLVDHGRTHHGMSADEVHQRVKEVYERNIQYMDPRPLTLRAVLGQEELRLPPN